MALLTLQRARGRHAAKTPIWRQFGVGRARHDLTAQPLVSPPAPEPVMDTAPVPALVSPERAREVVERLFPAGPDGLYPLDWQCSQGHATAQVDPGLVVDAARNVVLAYAAALDAPFMQETVEDRLQLRVSRAVDGVQVTVWADITPPPQLALPAPAPAAEPLPVLPIEEGVRRCVLDDTQVFEPITDDMDDPRKNHPDPDGDPEPQQIDPDHTPPADAEHTDPACGDLDQTDDQHDGDADEPPAATASTDDTSSTPLPPGDEDAEEETHSDG